MVHKHRKRVFITCNIGDEALAKMVALGYDNIDREAANRHGIPFTNTADVLTDATAEFAFFIMGALSRRLYPSETMVRRKEWKTWHPWDPFLGDEVTGKTASVIGTGRIGKAFVQKCSGFRMNLLCFDPYPDESFQESVQMVLNLKAERGLVGDRNVIRYVSMDEALNGGDYVSLHVPLNLETRHLIDEAAIRKMKASAYLINTSRGAIVDERALYSALKEEWIAGAALDVYEEEPLPADSLLRDPSLTERLRLFHHFGSGTKETRLSPDPDRGMAGRCVQGVVDVLEAHYGGNPAKMPYVVNKEAF